MLAIAILLVLGPARIAAAIPQRLREIIAAWARRVAPTPLVAAAAHSLPARNGPSPHRYRGALPGSMRFAAWVLGGPAAVVAGSRGRTVPA